MTPLFIGGCGRSGTTMLGDLLGVPAAHVCTPETTWKWRLVREDSAGAAWLARDAKFRELGVSLDGTPATIRALLESVVSRYATSIGRPDARVWIDHTPNNILMGEALLELFPDARFVEMVRDGRAIAASVIELDWGPNDEIEAAEQWMRYLAHGFALAAKYPGKVLRVRYEDVVREPEAWLQKICAFAELAYTPAMANGGGFRVPQSQAGEHKLVNQRPNPSRLDAWRNKLGDRQLHIFEFMVGELLSLNGYEPVYGHRAHGPTAFEELKYDAKSHLKHQLNRRDKRKRRDKAGFRPRDGR